LAPSSASPAPSGGLPETLARVLTAADRLDTVLGQQAVAIAGHMASSMQTGSSIAALSKELRSVLAEALEGALVVADPVDELRRRRDLKRVAG